MDTRFDRVAEMLSEDGQESLLNRCPHARSVLSYLELKKKDVALEAHLKECGICQEVYEKVEQMLFQVGQKIPEEKISREGLVEVEESLSAIVKEMNRAKRSRHIKKIKRVAASCGTHLRDVVAAVFSLRMMIFFVAVFMVAIAIKLFQ